MTERDMAGSRSVGRFLRRRGVRRMATVVAGGLVTGLALSACADIPQPSRPELTPYERPAVRSGDAGSFLTNYAESLDQALGEEPGALEPLQTGPLLERTRAEMLIAEQTGTTLGASSYTDVVAGGPMFGEYPMWFMAFATPEGEESDDVEAMLATRDSADADWKVAESVFVPAEAQPTILADQQGAVELAPDAHTEAADAVVTQASEYLTTGDVPEGAPNFEEAGFKDFRDYVGELGAEDTGFSDVGVECAPYEDLPLEDYALATEGGGVSFAESRCTITVNVPESYFVDLGDEIEAVMTSDSEGDVITIDVAQPMLITTEGDTASVYSPGWYMLSSETSGGGGDDEAGSDEGGDDAAE
ncbi:MAG: hypothetical protein ACTHVY_10120 [Brevibacterium yomogidense]